MKRIVKVKGLEVELDAEKVAKSLEQFTRDAKYFSANYQALRAQFPDEWVAVYQERVVSHNKSYRELLIELSKQKVTRGEYIERTYVKEKAPVFIFPAA